MCDKGSVVRGVTLEPSSRARAVLAAGAGVLSGGLLWAASPAVGAGCLAWVAVAPAALAAVALAGTRSGRLAVPLAFAVYLELLLVPALPFGLTEGQWGDPPLPILVGDTPLLAVALLAVPATGALLYLVRFSDKSGPTPATASAQQGRGATS